MTAASSRFTQKTKPIEKVAVSLRSNLDRSVRRSERAAAWRDYHGTRRPRRDDEIMAAWVLRGARRLGGVPVDVPRHDYRMDPFGPGATQMASVRCLRPDNDYERRLFEGLRVRPDLRTLNYLEEPPPLTARFGG